MYYDSMVNEWGIKIQVYMYMLLQVKEERERERGLFVTLHRQLHEDMYDSHCLLQMIDDSLQTHKHTHTHTHTHTQYTY